MRITDLALDFETMGSDPDSVVLSCALTYYDRNKLDYTFEELVALTHYFKFELDHQIEMGRTISKRTIEWWDDQDKEVRDSQFKPTDDDIELSDFIDRFYELNNLEGISKESIALCRGQSFDFPILKNIYQTMRPNHNPDFFPVAFWNQTDIRSLIRGFLLDMSKTKVPLPKGTLDGFKAHNPIHDNAKAVLQIQWGLRYASGEEIPTEFDEHSF